MREYKAAFEPDDEYDDEELYLPFEFPYPEL